MFGPLWELFFKAAQAVAHGGAEGRGRGELPPQRAQREPLHVPPCQHGGIRVALNMAARCRECEGGARDDAQRQRTGRTTALHLSGSQRMVPGASPAHPRRSEPL
jgi:hypothetical protein